MNQELEKQSLQAQFEHLLQENNLHVMRTFLDDQNISEIADLIYENPDHEAKIVANMSINRAAAVFKILDVSRQKDIINELPSYKTAELLNELPPDDRTDFLEELPKNVIRDLIKLLNTEERKITLAMLGYPEDSVGRLMTPDYVYVYPFNTIEQVLNTIRKVGKNRETIDVVYVVNREGELLDDLRIRDIILASPDKKIEELMDERIVALNVHDDQEHASEVFKMNNRVALPVTDDNNILLGIVTIDDMFWVANEEFSEDIQKIGGTEALDEPYLDTPLFKLVRKRAGWLIVLFLSELLTATAMAYFNDEITKATVLAMFIPLIMSSGGNSGSQASTLVIQAMAVGDITLADWWRVMRREIMSGILLGSILGIIGFARICIWHFLMHYGIIEDLYKEHWFLIAVSVGISLIGVVLWGTLTGSMLPIVLKKLGADPAVSSAPFVATLVDVTGIVIYFSIAYFFLEGILL
ncbi:MAG: magnesium transporter [Bacteroidetes bacterium]|nr:magnesium transporter [Bacteroidota bacterium]